MSEENSNFGYGFWLNRSTGSFSEGALLQPAGRAPDSYEAELLRQIGTAETMAVTESGGEGGLGFNSTARAWENEVHNLRSQLAQYQVQTYGMATDFVSTTPDWYRERFVYGSVGQGYTFPGLGSGDPAPDQGQFPQATGENGTGWILLALGAVVGFMVLFPKGGR